MPQSREDRIYLAYKVQKKSYMRKNSSSIGGLAHFFAITHICRIFNIGFFDAQELVKSRRTPTNTKK